MVLNKAILSVRDKMYIYQLSEDLNNIQTDLKRPVVNGMAVSHLLWADDLVFLALDSKSFQILIDKLKTYCDEWGLDVRISYDLSSSQTAIMIFNSACRHLKESNQFNYKQDTIPSAKSYTYLGISLILQ